MFYLPRFKRDLKNEGFPRPRSTIRAVVVTIGATIGACGSNDSGSVDRLDSGAGLVDGDVHDGSAGATGGEAARLDDASGAGGTTGGSAGNHSDAGPVGGSAGDQSDAGPVGGAAGEQSDASTAGGAAGAGASPDGSAASAGQPADGGSSQDGATSSDAGALDSSAEAATTDANGSDVAPSDGASVDAGQDSAPPDASDSGPPLLLNRPKYYSAPFGPQTCAEICGTLPSGPLSCTPECGPLPVYNTSQPSSGHSYADFTTFTCEIFWPDWSWTEGSCEEASKDPSQICDPIAAGASRACCCAPSAGGGAPLGTGCGTCAADSYCNATNRCCTKEVEIASVAIPNSDECSIWATIGYQRACGLDKSGERLYVMTGTGGLRVFDVSTPSAPLEIGAHDTPGLGLDVAVAGNHAFVADRTALRIIDVSNPASMTEVGSLAIPTRQVRVIANIAYVGTSDVIDVTDPTAPAVIGQLPSPLNDVALVGSTLFGVAWGYFYSVDMTDPSNPVEIASLRYERAEGLAVSGTHAFVATTQDAPSADFEALRVIDISDPAQPREVSKTTIWGHPGAVEVQGDHVFVGGTRLRIFDASDPTNPTHLGPFNLLLDAVAVKATASHAFVHGQQGLRVFTLPVCN